VAADRPPSGLQHAIEHGDHRAVVTQVGATLRECELGGWPVLDGFPLSDRASDGRGQVLAPWPNRLAAGRYSFDGRDCQAPVNEPSRGNAIHGLVRWLDWSLLGRDTSTVTLGCALRPQPGYEWPVDLEITYRLADDGLTVSLVATNAGSTAAPFGAGFHPYLSVGAERIDEVELQIPATSTLTFDDPDTSPLHSPVAGTSFDFRAARLVGLEQLDTAFGDLDRGADGRAVARLSAPDGSRAVSLWVSEGFGYLMVYTGDGVAAVGARRRSVAVEPMTCPPHAFRSGSDLLRLEPGQSWQATWGLRGR
jgi:aldose 1-epimerase